MYTKLGLSTSLAEMSIDAVSGEVEVALPGSMWISGAVGRLLITSYISVKSFQPESILSLSVTMTRRSYTPTGMSTLGEMDALHEPDRKPRSDIMNATHGSEVPLNRCSSLTESSSRKSYSSVTLMVASMEWVRRTLSWLTSRPSTNGEALFRGLQLSQRSSMAKPAPGSRPSTTIMITMASCSRMRNLSARLHSLAPAIRAVSASSSPVVESMTWMVPVWPAGRLIALYLKVSNTPVLTGSSGVMTLDRYPPTSLAMTWATATPDAPLVGSSMSGPLPYPDAPPRKTRELTS